MVVIGIKNNLIEICVSITPDQLQTLKEMYPELVFQEQTKDENIGWTFNGVDFTAPEV